MRAKSAQFIVSLLVLGLLPAAEQSPANELQPPAAISNMYGLTVADIYDLGVMVTDVEVGSRAAEIGLRKDDVILEVNGEPIVGADQFHKFIRELAGWPIYLTVSRLGQINRLILDTR
jgi:S1-C subfamily serine protease